MEMTTGKRICLLAVLLVLFSPFYAGAYATVPASEYGADGEEFDGALESYDPSAMMRPPEEQESVEQYLTEIGGRTGEEAESAESTGTLIVAARSSGMRAECVIAVLYDGSGRRYEFALTEKNAYSERAVLPAGTYDVIGAWETAEEGEVSAGYLALSDRIEVREGDTALVEVYRGGTPKEIPEEPEEGAVSQHSGGEGTEPRERRVLLSATLVAAAFLVAGRLRKHFPRKA